jgi:dipeptidyl aminopeptidase/acylaminoacyl peptidase
MHRFSLYFTRSTNHAMRKVFLTLLSLSATWLFAQNGNEPVKVTDMLKIKQAGNVVISPDGKNAVFVVTGIEPDGDQKWEYKYLSQIFLVPTDGSAAPRPLTMKENASQPIWSPDGKQLVFVRSVNTRPQLFLLSLEGGEPMQLTRFRYGAASPKWSPDGKQILFAASIPLKELLKDSILNPNREIPQWPYEKPGFPENGQMLANKAQADPDGNIDEIRAYLEKNEADRKAKVIDKLNFQLESATSGDISFNHFFIMDAQPDAKPTEITHGFFRYSSADFFPDGKKLIITGNNDATQHPDRALESMIFTANTDGSNLTTILSAKGKTYQSPKISPSGKWLAFQYGGVSFVDIPAMAIMPLNGSVKDITDLPFDRSKGNISWSSDEQWLYFSAQSNGAAPVFRTNIKSKQTERLTDTLSGIVDFDLLKNKLLFVKTEVADPFELYAADANGKNIIQLSSLNTEWLRTKKLSFPEKKSFVNEEGMRVDYWIMKPANYEAGKKYPAILDIHGGPSAMWGTGETSMWHEFQYYCARGYVVVYGNPRGSGGYGVNFLRANINNWGTGPTSDVLTYLDKSIAEGYIDSSKLAVTGGSYAGYLVAWIVGHDQRFKAAVSQRGVYDLSTFFGEGNAWRLVPNYFGGYPWEPPVKKILERESPITYVQNIHTPYLIFHGENDLRTGVIGGEMMYKSLKVLGRPVEYVRHPGGTHELTRSGNNRQRIDQMLRTMEFFERFIKH